MAPKYALNYFPAAGRAECARIMFKLAGVEFTDNQYAGEEWGKIKGDTKRFPLKQMPTLEVNGTAICQSGAIFRYLANEFGFYGGSNADKSVIDQVCETLIEIAGEVVKIVYYDKESTEEQKKVKLSEYLKSEAATLRLAYITALLKRNNEGNGYFVGNNVTLADILFFTQHEMVVKIDPEYINNYPELKALASRIGAVDVIKKHVEQRKY